MEGSSPFSGAISSTYLHPRTIYHCLSCDLCDIVHSNMAIINEDRYLCANLHGNVLFSQECEREPELAHCLQFSHRQTLKSHSDQ